MQIKPFELRIPLYGSILKPGTPIYHVMSPSDFTFKMAQEEITEQAPFMFAISGSHGLNIYLSYVNGVN